MHREFVTGPTGLGDTKSHLVTPLEYITDLDVIFGGTKDCQVLSESAGFIADTQLRRPSFQVDEWVGIHGLELPAMYALASNLSYIGLFVIDDTVGCDGDQTRRQAVLSDT